MILFNIALRFIFIGCFITNLFGCEVPHDLGQACAGGGGTTTGSPIAGEQPTVERVRISRDKNCDSLQCLEFRGLSPYCSRQCDVTSPATEAPLCTDDGDCELGFSCMTTENDSKKRCAAHDCPIGFSCSDVQSLGPLAGQLFCTRTEGCEKNIHCGDLGNLECITVGCLDRCVRGLNSEQLDGTTTSCEFHGLTCLPHKQLSCACSLAQTVDGAACTDGPAGDCRCADADLVCSGDCVAADGNCARDDVVTSNDGAAQVAWPEAITGGVERRGICLGKGMAL